ncbi:MAG: ubiquinone-dependent pyruvate dehydrogenase [Muribaculaceae bacterium]|nr:ubiquinone-dependent pyruvate dehydrogenase [Muribaculaceae bacterium]
MTDNKTPKTVADQVVEMIADAGIKHLYAITGDSLNEVNDAVRRNGKIDWIHVRHEETGAFAAGAEAMLTGRLACCAGSSGPGHVHLINGLYDANRANNAPVLAIASTCDSNQFGTQYFQETDTIRLFDDCSVYNQVANTPQQAPRMLQAAMQHAIEKKAVGVFGLPGNLTQQEAIAPTTSLNPQITPRKISPSDTEIAELAMIVNKAKKVTIYCGIGAIDAMPEVLGLARKLKAPVGSTVKSKFMIQPGNENYVGTTGLAGFTACYRAMHEADLLLLIGTDFPFSPFMPDDNFIAQIDIQPENIGRRANVRLGIAADAAIALQQLIPLVTTKDDTSFLDSAIKSFEDEQRLEKEAYIDHPGTKNLIRPEYVTHLLDQLADDDAVITVDTGMNVSWTSHQLNNKSGKRDLIGSFNHGSMANAMPQSIGCQLATPDRQVIAFCGDGGLTMLLGDLMTIVQYKLPIKLIVMDNRALGMVKLEMEAAGLPDWQTDLLNPDFAALAKVMGFTAAETVDDPAEVEAAMKRILAYNGPALLSVKTDPNAMSMPPKPSLQQAKGFAEDIIKLLSIGRGKEMIAAIKSAL